MLMVSPHVWMHYFTLLLFPFTAAIVSIRRNPGRLSSRVLAAGLVLTTIAFNAGARLFVSVEMSDTVDRVGVLSLGLVAFWASLAFTVLRRERGAAPATAAGPDLPAATCGDVSLA
jgi:hypothetical protein